MLEIQLIAILKTDFFPCQLPEKNNTTKASWEKPPLVTWFTDDVTAWLKENRLCIKEYEGH